MASELREFDFKVCPFCSSDFDMKRNHYWDFGIQRRTYVLFTFKCHSCSTVYAVSPVVTSYLARPLPESRGNSAEMSKPLAGQNRGLDFDYRVQQSGFLLRQS